MSFQSALEAAKQQHIPTGLIYAMEHGQDEKSLLGKLGEQKWTPEGLNKALATAADKGYMQVSRKLIELGADPKSNDGQILWATIYRNDTGLLKEMLERGVVYKAHGSSNADLLSYAAQCDSTEAVKLLLNSGAWPADVKKGSDNSAAFKAGFNGNYEMAKLLLEHGDNGSQVIAGACCSYDGKGRSVKDGSQPEGLSTEKRKQLIELGLEHAGDINYKERNSIYLARTGQLEVLKWAHQEKGLRLVPDAIIEAAEFGYMREVKWLVEQGVDPNTKQGEALLRASKNNHDHVAKYLQPLRANAKPEDRDLWVDSTGTRAPAGLEKESPYGMNMSVFHGFVSDFKAASSGFIPINAEIGVNQRAHRLAVLFGSDEVAAQFAAKWQEQLEGKSALHAISEFQLPKSGKWNIEGWRAAALKHGPSVLPLVEHAAQFTEMPGDHVFEAAKGMNLSGTRGSEARLGAANATLRKVGETEIPKQPKSGHTH